MGSNGARLRGDGAAESGWQVGAAAAFRRLIGVGVALTLMFLIVGYLESSLVFFPMRGEQATPDALRLSWTRLAVPTSDGETLTAWWLHRADARADVIHFHGNGGNLSLWLPVLAGIHARGVNVLGFDYRGYGTSTGRPTEQGLHIDAEAIARTWQTRLAGGRPVIYWGRSLGGAIAAHAAVARAPDGLVLESTFPDKASVIRLNPVLRVLNLFGRYRFDTLARARDLRCPALVIHGDRDSVIRYALGIELFEGLRGPKEFVRVAGADHNDVEPAAPEYWQAVDRFVHRVATQPE